MKKATLSPNYQLQPVVLFCLLLPQQQISIIFINDKYIELLSGIKDCD